MSSPQLILDFEGRRLRGVRPFASFESCDGAWTWQSRRASFPFRNGQGDAVAEMQRALQWCSAQSTLGAAIGFWSYDFARQLEPRVFSSTRPPTTLPTSIPDVRLVFFEELREEDLTEYQATLLPTTTRNNSQETDAKYFDSVERVKELIAAGDIYQANLVQPYSVQLKQAPHVLYERLCASHPMPFSALLEWDDFAIVSNSPERFVLLKNRELLTQPIKGTIRRGQNAEEDETLRHELQNSIKDRAENVMIVDLLRNDLGRVCEWGSVQVPQLWQVQTFGTLHHLVSTVTGTLRPDCDAVTALKVLFPCGSITGAPKIRAMQIIDEIEQTRRGVSMGAIGYFGFNGDMEWNVAIRTLTCIDGYAYGHTGGGIVADSDPASEYQEMLLKRQGIESVMSAGILG
jgi:aminodeoxychorismate synthase component I